MKIIQSLSSHRQNGWQGQYIRMIRWVRRFNLLVIEETLKDDKTHDYFDTMYACFQDIFFLKDWLENDTRLTRQELNEFINLNKEIGICRDICNGTKHYNISNASIDKEFGIIKQFNPLHEKYGEPEYEIIICAGGCIFKPCELINKCILIWDKFIYDKLDLELKIQ